MRNKQRKLKAKKLSQLGLKKSLKKKKSLKRFIKSGHKRKGYEYKQCPKCDYSWYRVHAINEVGGTNFKCDKCDHVWADDVAGTYWTSIQKRYKARSKWEKGGGSDGE